MKRNDEYEGTDEGPSAAGFGCGVIVIIAITVILLVFVAFGFLMVAPMQAPIALRGPVATQQFLEDEAVFRSAIAAFRSKHGRGPSTLEELAKEGTIPRQDPYAYDYTLEVVDEDVLRIVSPGADGLPGGEGENSDEVFTFAPPR